MPFRYFSHPYLETILTSLPSKIETFKNSLLAGDRAVLARAITLIESTKTSDVAEAKDLLQHLLPHSGRAVRLGISGVPGVGKSTIIDQLGMNLVQEGYKVAVLAVDPTSKRTGGSILGDKTRMVQLSQHPNAFIRPSPTSGSLGGVTRKTRETIVLVEAAGYDIVIVETVGVGQSEVAVADMVDFFLVLLLAGGGDDLQGIKKGIIELADMIAINKADGENINRAKQAANDYENAISIFTPKRAIWKPPVITISARFNLGLEELWKNVMRHKEIMTQNGQLIQRRQNQAVEWMHQMLKEGLIRSLETHPEIARRLSELEAEVKKGQMLPTRAVDEILALLEYKI